MLLPVVQVRPPPRDADDKAKSCRATIYLRMLRWNSRGDRLPPYWKTRANLVNPRNKRAACSACDTHDRRPSPIADGLYWDAAVSAGFVTYCRAYL